MAEHIEGFAEDVGGKLLLLAGLLAIFGVVALVLMPLGAAFAPPATPVAAATAPATDSAAAPADTNAAAAEAAPAPASAAAPAAEAAAPAAAAPQGPPPFIAAFFPGIIMLIVAAILGAISGLFLGYAKARSDEAEAAPGATAPH